MRLRTLNHRRRRKVRREQRMRRGLITGIAMRRANRIVDQHGLFIVDVAAAESINAPGFPQNMVTVRIKTNYLTPDGARFYCHFGVSRQVWLTDKSVIQERLFRQVPALLAAFIVNQRIDRALSNYIRMLNRMSLKTLRRIDESEHQLVGTTW